MSRRTIGLADDLRRYLLDNTLREPEALRALRADTAALGDVAGMQISPEQGQLMALLARLTGARRVLEVGTFTGYSALAVALALPPDGRLVACDVSAEWTAIARHAWAAAGLGDRIELRLGPAAETLRALARDPGPGAFDMMFIDADKEGYGEYYERGLTLVRAGGLILLDNMFRDGAVADPARTDPGTVAIRDLTRRMQADPRVDFSVVPIGDGLALARKR